MLLSERGDVAACLGQLACHNAFKCTSTTCSHRCIGSCVNRARKQQEGTENGRQDM